MQVPQFREDTVRELPIVVAGSCVRPIILRPDPQGFDTDVTGEAQVPPPVVTKSGGREFVHAHIMAVLTRDHGIAVLNPLANMNPGILEWAAGDRDEPAAYFWPATRLIAFEPT